MKRETFSSTLTRHVVGATRRLLGVEVGNQNIRLLKRLIFENFWSRFRLYGIAILAMALMAGATAASAWIMREIVNGMIVEQSVSKTLGVAVAVAAIFTVKGAANYVQAIYLSRAGNSIIAEQQRNIFGKIIQGDMEFMSTKESSDILLRVTHAAQMARGIIDTIVVSFVRDLFTLVGLVLVMVIQAPLLSLFGLLFGPIALYGVRILMRQVRAIMQQEMTSLNTIIRIVQETTTGFRVIKAYRLEDAMQQSMNDAISNVEQRANAIARIQSATSPLMETLAGLAIAGVIAFASLMVLQRGQSPGEIMSFITALLLAYEPAKRLARMRVEIESGMVGIQMLFELLDHPIKMLQKPDAIDLPSGNGRITFRNVNFSYRDGEPILKDLNLTFDSGKVTALVGPSGAGKSTIINLVMRLYDPDSGSVSIDGVNIADVTFASLRDRISYVGQDAFLFSGSIRHNIRLGKIGAPDEEIVAAAKSANAHSFIMSMPEGYDTVLGENGNTLSGGQKQRLTIARAFLRDSEILILDEATSALDSNAEIAIKEAVEYLAKGRTTIVIAHRLSTVARADHIVVMDQGEVSEQGSPAELLKQDGLYSQLYKHQLLPSSNDFLN